MSDRSVPAHGGFVAAQLAEIIVSLDGEGGRRGSGYRVGPTTVLTAAHVIKDAVAIQMRFDADQLGEWTTDAISHWTDPQSDLAVLSIAPHAEEPPVTVARFGRIGGDQLAVLRARAVGFPRFKFKPESYDGTAVDWYRDSHQVDGTVAVLSNRREGTLELTVAPPERDPEASPWEGMSGAAVWVADRIVGVIAEHHPSDGLGRLAAIRLDRALNGLEQGQRAELQMLLDLPDALPDVVPPPAGERITTAYQTQVRDLIAPDQLLDREEELNELVGFCAGDRPYAWWQAGPWAGKSALMAWFVLHPPAEVDVVSFFVAARLGQSDSDACTDALIEQLAALVGESPADALTAGARQGTMLRLLDEAAKRARETRRRLLLVIDGLDEDSSAAIGLGHPSIAALLPRRPPAEVRVLVASRPHPPIPSDVTGYHPLRKISPRQLDVSEHARDVEYQAKRELTQFLAGTQSQRDVLGLITAARGGLTLGDLEELTEQPPYEIEGLLGGIFGRSIESRTDTPASERPDERVYLLAHETLRLTAEQGFGNSLAVYRALIHAWADSYRQRVWPTDTPQYLLRGYPRLLASTRNLIRLVACATDPARHDRMRSLTGGDALALTEISTAQQLLLAQPELDLTSLALIAVQREHLTERNTNIPAILPTVWAKLGQLSRAEALAHSIPDPDSRAKALGYLAEVVAAGGDPDRAEALITQITDPDSRAEVLCQLAKVVAIGRNPDRLGQLSKVVSSGDPARSARLASEAEACIAQITNRDRRAELLIQLMDAVTTIDDPDWEDRLVSETVAFIAQMINPASRAKMLGKLTERVATCGDFDQIEALSAPIADLDSRAKQLIQLAKAATAIGDPDRVFRLASEVEALIAQITNSDRAQLLGQLVKVVAACGDIDWAEALISQITDPFWQAKALGSLAEEVAASGDLDKAETLIAQMPDADSRADALGQLAKAVAASGDFDRAQALIAQITDPDSREMALESVAEIAVASGDLDRAESFIVQVTDPDWRAELLSQLAETAAASGDPDRAEALSARLTSAELRAEQLSKLAEAAAEDDEHEALITQITPPSRRAELLSQLAETVAFDDPDRAARLAGEVETLIAQITNPDLRVEQLSRLAEAVAASGDPDRATWLVNEAEALIALIADPDSQAEALGRLAQAAAVSGDLNRAEAFIAQITDADLRAEALGRLAETVATNGDPDRAEALIAQITRPNRRARALSWLAIAIARTNEKTSPVRERLHHNSPVLIRARRLLGEALATGSWIDVAPSLALLDRPAVSALADELQVRWKLNDPADSQEGRER